MLKHQRAFPWQGFRKCRESQRNKRKTKRKGEEKEFKKKKKKKRKGKSKMDLREIKSSNYPHAIISGNATLSDD